MGVVGAGRNRYYRKISSSDTSWNDISASAAFGDTFDGTSTTTVIEGGADNQLYYSDIKIPIKSYYDGSSSLVGLKYYFFPTDITLDNDESLPLFKVWKTKTHIGDNNEGTLEVNKRNLTVFTSQTDINASWRIEKFNGTASRITKIAQEKLIEYGDPYITIAKAVATQSKDYFPMDAEEMQTRHGEEITAGYWVVFLEKKKLVRTVRLSGLGISWDASWIPRDGRTEYVNDVWFQYLEESDVSYTAKIKVSAEKEENVSPNETIASDIFTKGSKDIIDDDGNPIFKASVTFSTDRSLEGQSLKMKTRWAIGALPGASSTGQTIPPDSGLVGAADRQEAIAVFDVPLPATIDTAGSETLRDGDKTAVNWDGQDGMYGYSKPCISLDLFIDEISPAFKAKSDAHDTSDAINYTAVDNIALVRGFAFMFSRTKPTTNESFASFFRRTTSPAYDGLLSFASGGNYPRDASLYASATGLIVSQLPVNFGEQTNLTEATRNLDRDTLGNRPIMAMPLTGQVRDSYNSFPVTGRAVTDEAPGFYSGNLADKSSSDGHCFHEFQGPTVWHHVTSDYQLSRIGAEIPQSVWLTFRFKFYANFIAVQIKNTKTEESISTWMPMSPYPQAAGSFTTPEYSPRYLSIWNFNYPGDAVPPVANAPDDFQGGSTADFQTENTMFIDNITYDGFNNLHSNGTVSQNNRSPGRIDIMPTKSYIAFSDDIEETVDIDESEVFYNNTYISFGFDTLNEFDKNASSGTTNFFFNNLTYNTTVSDIYHDSTNIAIRAGFTSGADNERIGCQASQSFFTYESGSPANSGKGWPFVNKGLSTAGAVANRGFDFKGTSQIELFSNKGGLIFDFNSQAVNFGDDTLDSQCGPAKRENIFCSARVLGINGAEEGWIQVDNKSIFDLDDSTEYAIFIYGRGGVSADAYTNIFLTDYNTYPTNKSGLVAKVLQRDGDNIQFDKDVTITQYGTIQSGKTKDQRRESWGLCTEEFAHRVFISPLKYWITLEVRPTSDTEGTPGTQRSYGRVATVNQGDSLPISSSYGATYNESTFTDADNYLKRRNLMPAIKDSSIETQTDYGNKIMDAADNTGAGYISEAIIEENLDTRQKWLVFDASSIIEEDKLEGGEIFSSVVAASNRLNSSSITIATSENTDKVVNETYGSSNTKRPFALAIYEDKLPSLSSFEVNPNEDSPFFPEFTWKCGDEDAWYGFVIIDTEPPTHQYHKSPVHIPMWRPLPSTENTFMHWPPSEDDSEPDIIDYINDEVYYYGEDRGHTYNDDYEISVSTVKGVHTKGSIEDYTKFLDPEGLSGWCHNFQGNDKLLIPPPESSDSGDIDTSVNEQQSSFIFHIRPSEYPPSYQDMGILTTYGSKRAGICIWLDTDGRINASFAPFLTTTFVHLTSHSVAPKDGSPTCIIVTFDKDLTHGNCKLYLNGKLEDLSGKAKSTMTSSNWKIGDSLDLAKGDSRGTWEIGDSPQAGQFKGKMEEVVYYPHVIYPVIPANGKFIWTKPVTDLDSNGKPISYFARLFIKDYHNIRGTGIDEVASSTTVTIHKAGVAL